MSREFLCNLYGDLLCDSGRHFCVDLIVRSPVCIFSMLGAILRGWPSPLAQQQQLIARLGCTSRVRLENNNNNANLNKQNLVIKLGLATFCRLVQIMEKEPCAIWCNRVFKKITCFSWEKFCFPIGWFLCQPMLNQVLLSYRLVSVPMLNQCMLFAKKCFNLSSWICLLRLWVFWTPWMKNLNWLV